MPRPKITPADEMLFRNPRALAFVLIFGGLGLAAWFGDEYYRQPRWSEAEIEQSVELNLQLDLRRMGPQLAPTGARLAQLRQRIRDEVEGEVKRDREQPLRWVGAGLILAVAGLGNLLFATLASRKP